MRRIFDAIRGWGLAKCHLCGRVLPQFGWAGGLRYAHAKCSGKVKVVETLVVKRSLGTRRDPEAIIQEYGAEKLVQTAEGRRVIEDAKAKYPELIQPGEPGFEKYWGKEVRQREKDMAEVRAESQRLKREKGMV